MFRLLLVAAAASGFVFTTPAAFAGTLSSYTLPSGAVVPVNTQVPNNFHNISPNPNVFSLPGTTEPALSFDNLNPIDIVFSGQQSVGLTSYFVQDSVTNQSGADWSGFWLQIGIGTGANFQGDLNGNVNSQLTTFSAFPPAPTASAFTLLGAQPIKTLKWLGGAVPAGGRLELSFTIDAADIPIPFTLRQFPIAVPEPTTIVLFVVGATGLLIASLRI